MARRERTTIRDNYEFQCSPTDLQKGVINFLTTYQYSILDAEAGCGKDFCSMYYALRMLNNSKTFDKILVTKSLVEVGKSAGYLPGSLEEKIAPYNESISANVKKIIGEEGYRKLVNSKRLQFVPLNYVRGNTFENSIIILTECQNVSLHELITFTTRVADTSRLLMNGDLLQSDIKNSGFATFIELMKGVEEFGYMQLGDEYQMRNPIITKINRIYREYLANH